jgi:plasmid stabilization system protein ParE
MSFHPEALREAQDAFELKYPYVVYYSSGPAEMIVTAIFHSSRDPRRWADRVHENAGSMVAIYSADCPA